MKLLFIGESDTAMTQTARYAHSRNWSFFTYTNPIKAMDNLDELDPDIILFRTQEFPRHWKPFLTLLREERSKDETVFVLLKGSVFPFEEAAKAVHLGANGILDDDLAGDEEYRQLDEIIARYKSYARERVSVSVIPDESMELAFLFTHPDDFALVTGEIEEISIRSLRFRPDATHTVQDIDPGTVLPACSLRIGKEIRTLSARVHETEPVMLLEFLSLGREGEQLLGDYLHRDHSII